MHVNLYRPSPAGGGHLVMDVSHTLTVDGYIQANSRDVRNTQNSLASGGSGGSIIIRAVNITGRVTLLTSQVGSAAMVMHKSHCSYHRKSHTVNVTGGCVVIVIYKSYF